MSLSIAPRSHAAAGLLPQTHRAPPLPADFVEVNEAAWCARSAVPDAVRLPSPSKRRRGPLAPALRPYMSAIMGTAALTWLVSSVAAYNADYYNGVPTYVMSAARPATRFFSSDNGAIVGTVNAPWDVIGRQGHSKVLAYSAASLADNFINSVVLACQGITTNTSALATPTHLPAYVEPNWFVRVSVNAFNVSGALSDAVQCMFQLANRMGPVTAVATSAP